MIFNSSSSATNLLLTPDIAEVTTTIRFPRPTSPATNSAALRMRSPSPTEVPPNLIVISMGEILCVEKIRRERVLPLGFAAG